MAINYRTINKQAIQKIISVSQHTKSISPHLKALVELRVSQINGCAFCVNLHTTQARELGVESQLLDCLIVWHECQLFSKQDMAALSWAESVTQIASEKHIEDKLETLLTHFNETEAVDLTIIIALMNSLNRIAIGFGDKPLPRT